MQAAVVTRFGDPDVFALTELPDPVPGPMQVAIDVSHAAVGLADVYIRQGLYRERKGLPQPPYVPGLEVAGAIRALGECVTGTVRRTSLAAGQSSALPYDSVIASEDLLDTVEGQRFDVVVDPVGGQIRTESLQVMAPLGRMLLVGNASGDWEHQVSTNALWRSNLALLGFAVGSYLPAHPEQTRPAAQGALNAISQGLVDIHTQTLPLAQAAEAHRRLENGAIAGRILLTPA